LGDDDGKIFIGTYSGLDLITKGKDNQYFIQTLLPDVMVKCLLRDSHGMLWIGTWENGIYRYDGKTFVNYSRLGEVQLKKVTCLYADQRGKLWAGLMEAGIASLENEGFVLNPDPLLRQASIMDIIEDQNHTIWLSRCGRNLYVKKGPGKKNNNIQ